jgi:hypothetical protein
MEEWKNSSKPPLSPSIMEVSEWTTPPTFTESPSNNITFPQMEPIAGHLHRGRTGNPTCLWLASLNSVLTSTMILPRPLFNNQPHLLVPLLNLLANCQIFSFVKIIQNLC